MSNLPPQVQTEVDKSYHGFAKDQPVKTLPPFAPKKGVVVAIPGTTAIATGDQRITVRIDDGRTFLAPWKNLAPRLGLSIGQLIEEPDVGTGYILRFQKSSPDKVVIEVLMIKGEHTGHVMALTLNLMDPASPAGPQTMPQSLAGKLENGSFSKLRVGDTIEFGDLLDRDARGRPGVKKSGVIKALGDGVAAYGERPDIYQLVVLQNVDGHTVKVPHTYTNMQNIRIVSRSGGERKQTVPQPQRGMGGESKRPPLDRLTAFLRAKPGSPEEARLKRLPGRETKRKSEPDEEEAAERRKNEIEARRAANIDRIESRREARRIAELIAEKRKRNTRRGGRRRRRTKKRRKKHLTKRRRPKSRRKTRRKRKRRRHRR